MERGQPSTADLFLHIPFTERWDFHKNTIYRLYIDEGRAVDDVADIMKQQYLFDANVRQYKHHFKKWGMFKCVPSTIKGKAIQTLGKRVRDGIEFGGIRYKGVEIDKKRLRRYINDEIQLDPALGLSPSVFARWNLPLVPHMIPVTPDGNDSSTPSDFSVISPPAHKDPQTPTNTASTVDAPTPTVRALQARTHHDRAKSFVQGEIEQFLKGMSSSDKRVVMTWLHEYWMFAFKTSKHWGKGPRKWTADLLKMIDFQALDSFHESPAVWRENQGLSPLGNTQNEALSTAQQREPPQPSSLCRWCIHAREPSYTKVPSPSLEEETNYDEQDMDSWPTWAEEPCTVVERLHNALEDNSFSSINAQDLPLSTSVVATAAAASPDAMTVEAIAFAIMARNSSLVGSFIGPINIEGLNLSSIYPYHLAASYLDGSNTCCEIFLQLTCLFNQNAMRNLYVNNLGHTILDSLMLTILKGHTSCTPIMADENLKDMTRFPGENVDICGRWDADSSSLRALNAKGSPIPFSWKHMFCHTSVQAICHSIIRLFSRNHSPDINTPSGLFTKSCFTCGDKLVPWPLHTLVLTAFNLAQHGCHGENLFGIVACLVCMLTYGADPMALADLSVDDLLEIEGIDEQDQCTHSLLDPLELGEKVTSAARVSWSTEVKLGWDCLMAVLGFAQRQRTCGFRVLAWSHEDHDIYFNGSDFLLSTYQSFLNHSEGDDDFDYDECNHDDICTISGGRRRHLGVLWSAIQAELLTYRRLRDGDPWLSENFSLATIRDGANEDIGFSRLPLMDRKMTKPACRCGRFITDSVSNEIVTVDEACSFYFSNMEDWQRSTYRLFFV